MEEAIPITLMNTTLHLPLSTIVLTHEELQLPMRAVISNIKIFKLKATTNIIHINITNTKSLSNSCKGMIIHIALTTGITPTLMTTTVLHTVVPLMTRMHRISSTEDLLRLTGLLLTSTISIDPQLLTQIQLLLRCKI